MRLCGMTMEELEKAAKDAGVETYRVKQVLKWVYERGVTDFEKMTDLPGALRKKLGETLEVMSTRVTARQEDPDGTVKLLVELGDGNGVECVLIRRGSNRTGCISTQVGCAVRCVFCASGAEGLVRNLEAGEIVEQALHLAGAGGEYQRMDNLVFMGVGEPMFNYEAVVKAIRILNAPWGMGLAARRMTVSTVGVPGTIERLGEEGLQVNLAISLHSGDDRKRKQIIPHAGVMKVNEVVGSAVLYREKTGRDVTFEYVLIAGVNDSAEDAGRLVRVLKGQPATVNVIELNEVEGSELRGPGPEAVRGFVEGLKRAGLNVTHRRRKGARAGAACGQLRLHRGLLRGPT